MTAGFYHRSKITSAIREDLLAFIEEHKDTPSWAPWASEASDWDACINLPDELLMQDPFLAWLYDREPFSGGILRMAPWTNYAWHQDYQRGCSLNLLLTDPLKSRCLFRHRPSDQIHRMFHIVNLPYDTGNYFCLNTQVEHSVFNWEEDRFVFTLHFERELGEFTYMDLLKLVLSYRQTGT
jgi:hypothetical protein